MDERERAHLVAVTELAAGRWHSAGLRLEELAATWPHDELALMAAHQVDFMRGDSRMLRDRIARALPAWDAGRPGWHAMLGMYALAVHNTWHLALFHLTEGEPEQVLRLYDEGIGGPGSPAVIDLIDATAMLWRLRLLGIDVGNRWQPVAERWAAAGPLGGYAFNAVHALMAYIATGRSHEQQEVLEALVAASHADDDSAVFAREAGLPVARPAGTGGGRSPRCLPAPASGAQPAASLRWQPCPARPVRPDPAGRGGARRRNPPARRADGGTRGGTAGSADQVCFRGQGSVRAAPRPRRRRGLSPGGPGRIPQGSAPAASTTASTCRP